MKSEYRVTCQDINGRKMYAVYRLINRSEVDHSGNREYATSYMDDEKQAEHIAESLNNEQEETK